MAWLLVGVAGLVATAGGWVMWRRMTMLRVENERWRSLARDRADQAPMLSHEVRAPVALVSGAAEVLLDGHLGDLTERQRRLVHTIALNANAIATLSENFLAASRIDSQVFSMRTEMVNLRRLVRQVLADLGGLYDNTLTLESRGYPPHLRGHPQLLRQVVINLVTNAVRHSGSVGAIRVTLRRNEGSVLLVVSDDGCGMTPLQRRELFHRTLEGKSETGTGLGMIITQRIVAVHGGLLLIDTEAAHGTSVIAQFPVAPGSLGR